MVPSEKVWPTLSCVSNTARARHETWFVTGIVSLSSLGLAFFLDWYYGRTETDDQSLAISSLICATGFISVLVPTVWFLSAYNARWLGVLFCEVLLLVILLVSTKGYLIAEYPYISSHPIEISLFSAYISAALLEELIKILTYVTPILVSPKYRTVHDLVFFAVCAGTSFATIENLIAAHSGISTVLRRFIWCTATHTSDCVSGALVLAYIKTSPIIIEWKWWCKMCLYPFVLLLPMTLHGSYDYVIFISKDLDQYWIASLSIVIGAISLAIAGAMFWPFRHRRPEPIAVDVVVACA